MLADPTLTADERAAARGVMHACAHNYTPPGDYVAVLARYVRRIQEQDRWGH